MVHGSFLDEVNWYTIMTRIKKSRLKTPDDIKRIKDAGVIIADIFSMLKKISFDGMSTLDLDALVESEILKNAARASFKTVPGYSHATCISVNSEVVHGIPSKKKIIMAGDIVKVDVGTVKNGFFADACYTFAVEPITEDARMLIAVAKESLSIGLNQLTEGNRLGSLGAAIQEYVERRGFNVVRDFTGHGVGFAVHEPPTVLHYGIAGTGKTLQEGMVLAVEPMVNQGSHEVVTLKDGWTTVTRDGKLSAQFEHTAVVTAHGPEILTI